MCFERRDAGAVLLRHGMASGYDKCLRVLGEVALHLNNRLDAMVPGFMRHARSKQITAVEAERFTPKGEVGLYKFPPMVMAEVEVRGGIDLELRALQWLYGTSLPRSGLPVSWPT